MPRCLIPNNVLHDQLFPGAKVQITSIKRQKDGNWIMEVAGEDVPNTPTVTAVVIPRHVILQAVDVEVAK